MDHHQQNRRRTVEAGGGGQNHPPPQPCPRCNSNNTKFCYYNNYSLSQPRFFCKGCRRYWTQGGTLRNVPVGGGCRKSKRPKLATTSSANSGTCSQSQLQSLSSQPQPPAPPLNQPQVILNAQDHRLSVLGNQNNNNNSSNNNTSNNSTGGTINTSGGGTMVMGHGFYGGGNQGFLSSLAAMQQGLNHQQLGFGPNLGLMPGFSLPPGFNHQPQHSPNESIPTLYSSREVGSSSTPTIQEWNLRMGTGPGPGPVPVVEGANNPINTNHNRRDQNNIDYSQTNQQWSNFMGTSGLDEP